MKMDASGWSQIISSVTSGAADIISSSKGNYSKNATSFGLGIGNDNDPPSGTSSIMGIALLGVVVMVVVKLFR